MASTCNFVSVTLTENDVPGAKLDTQDFGKYSNTQLKRWLQCRGLPVSGNRPNLLARCQIMEHKTAILQNIHEEITKGTFNDLEIVCNNGTTTGSRITLAALSPYFRAMLTADMKESRTGSINLPSISLAVFQGILNMSLCEVDLINEHNCIMMLDTAEMMQLHHVKQLCYNHLKKDLVFTAENCLSWWRLMKKFNFSDLSDSALNVLILNLQDFLKTENALLLSKEELLEIISNDNLECMEDDVVKGVMKWIKKNDPQPDDVTDLFEKLKLDCVGREFLLKEVLFSDIVVNNSSIQKKIQTLLRTQLSPIQSKSRYNPKVPVVDMFVLHRDGNSLLSRFKSDNTWQAIPPAPVNPGYWYSAEHLGDKIYITGGGMKRRCTLIYDISGNMWQTGPKLTHGRHRHCMATANSKLYVIGGEYTNTLEVLSEDVTDWQVVGDLKKKREFAFAVTVNQTILVMGGRTDGNQPSDIIQSFNTATNTVSNLSLKLPCRSVAVRGSIHLPDVFLLDNDGNVMHIRITNRDEEIQIQTMSTAKWKSFDYFYGIIHRNNTLLCFNNNSISTYNFAECTEETNTFPKPQRTGYIFGVVPVPRKH